MPTVAFVAIVELLVLLFAANSPAGETPRPGSLPTNEVCSPNGSVQFKLIVRDAGLHYAVNFRNKPVIESSALGIRIDGTDMTQGVEVGQPARREISETYPWRGVHSLATNRCHVATFPLHRGNGAAECTLEVRAFDDGAAFRYLVPGSSDRLRTPDEATRFVLPEGSIVWSHNLRGHYEGEYTKQKIAEVAAGEWLAPPVTFKLPDGGGYASITEAALVHYSGMALQADGRGGLNLMLGHKHPVSYPFELRYKEDIPRMAQPAAIRGTIVSPWRVVLVGADLGALVNSDVVPNLCPPPDAKLFPKGINTPWIKPGRAVWKYLDGGSSTLAGMKEFSRWAGELGFEYHVIEGFWSRWSDDDLRQLVAYSRQQGVGLWFWIHSKQLRTPEARAAFFQRLHELGVVGAKIDFFDHEHEEIVDLYTALLEEAAKNQVMVNFHGANKPTGESRTWPNELVREAIRGMEASRLKQRAVHDVTLPFTRFLAGPADYTPVHFGARRADTTWAHQIATAVVFTAPLLTYGAHPSSILKNPGLEMIKSIPAVWDETVVLPISEIGEIAAFARRSGNTWFLAILNGPTARTAPISLSFLAPGTHRALIVRDDPGDPAAVEIENRTARQRDHISVQLGAGGGFVGRFSPRGE